MTTTFFRVLKDKDKEPALKSTIDFYNEKGPNEESVFTVYPEKFKKVPNSPFAYWVDDSIRELFQKFPPFESEGRTVKQGLATADDFRFVRTWWEVPAEKRLDAGNGPDWRDDIKEFQKWCRGRTKKEKYWAPFAKGGEYSPYYSDIHLVVNWKEDGEEIKNFVSERYPYLKGKWEWVVKNTDYYFRPGLTWPRRTNSRFGVYVFPSGCIFADKGPVAFVDKVFLMYTLSLMFSSLYDQLIDIFMAGGDETQSGTPSRSYEVGIIQKLPFIFSKDDDKVTVTKAENILNELRSFFSANTTDLNFTGNHFIKATSIKGIIIDKHLQWNKNVFNNLNDFNFINKKILEFAEIPFSKQAKYNDVEELLNYSEMYLPHNFDGKYKETVYEAIRELLKESGGNRQVSVKSYYASRRIELLSRLYSVSPKLIIEYAEKNKLVPDEFFRQEILTVTDMLSGFTFGRWDIRMAIDPSLVPELADPFDPLPLCPPATLVGPDGLPAKSGNIVSDEWLKARPNAITLPPEGTVSIETIEDSEYPVEVPWDGILVDDPGKDRDIIERMRKVMEIIWKDKAYSMEQEACENLGVKDIREYFRKPSGFFEDHLNRYSKSRRKAPIYWPLSTKSGNYTIWIYYPRLSEATLYGCVNIIDEKIKNTENDLQNVKKKLTEEKSTELKKEYESLSELLDELREMKEELLRVAALPYKPDLDDGVVICAAPLKNLFRLSKWKKELEKHWKALEKGEYDWAHLAMTIWPDRVKEKCKSDKSLAIAHGLEELYEN